MSQDHEQAHHKLRTALGLISDVGGLERKGISINSE